MKLHVLVSGENEGRIAWLLIGIKPKPSVIIQQPLDVMYVLRNHSTFPLEVVDGYNVTCLLSE